MKATSAKGATSLVLTEDEADMVVFALRGLGDYGPKDAALNHLHKVLLAQRNKKPR